MATFMDVHEGMTGITREQLATAHKKDQDIEGSEGVRFIKAWADPKTGKVFCLSEAPNKDAVMRVHSKAGHPATEVHEVSVTVE
jgi:hypothetical protein